MRGRIRCTFASAVAMAILTWAASIAPAEARSRFDLPAQALADSLRAVGSQTNLNVLFDPPLVADHQAPALKGEYTTKQAFTLLLVGTGIRHEFMNERTVVLAAAPAASSVGSEASSSAPPPTSSTSDPGSSSFETSLQGSLGSSKSFWQRFRLAQNDPNSQNTESTQNQSSQSSSSSEESADSSGRKMEEVIVTAQKREERLIDTPISISVLSGEDLARSSSRGVADVLNQVGGVIVTQTSPGETQIAVRGVAPGAGSTTVAYYLDEVPFSFYRLPGVVDSNAFDLARVEVLRGSQGTLYGGNALSGVVRVLTNDANPDVLEANVRVRGSYTGGGADNYGGDLALNVPLIPGTLAIRGVAGYSELSGFIDSTFDGKSRINDTRAPYYRFKINYKPTENLSAKLGYWRSEINNGAPSTSSDDFTTPFSSDQPDERVSDVYNLVGEYTWPSVSLLSSTGYIEYAIDAQSDLLLVGARTSLLGRIRMKSFSQEFRLSSHLNGPWRWLAGLFYRESADTSSFEASIFPSVFQLHNESESYAVFGDVTRSFNEGRFELTAGVRFFEDRQVTSEEGDFFARPLLPDRSVEFNHTTGRLVFAYRPQRDSMFYGSVATGFRSGQLQGPGTVRADPSLAFTVDPDVLTTYELGAKGLLLDGALTYEAAVYYLDWEDIQQELILPIGFVARDNAGSASGLGVDTTVSYQPNRALTLQASLGWNDLQMAEEVFSRGVVLLSKGSRVNNSPEWTGSVGGSYRLATPISDADFVLSGNFAYGSLRSLRFLTAGVVNETQSEELRVLTASAGLVGDRWSTEIYADNLLNDNAAITPVSPNQFNSAARQRPRTIGLQVRFNY